MDELLELFALALKVNLARKAEEKLEGREDAGCFNRLLNIVNVERTLPRNDVDSANGAATDIILSPKRAYDFVVKANEFHTSFEFASLDDLEFLQFFQSCYQPLIDSRLKLVFGG